MNQFQIRHCRSFMRVTSDFLHLSQSANDYIADSDSRFQSPTTELDGSTLIKKRTCFGGGRSIH